jgi:hypothetical protein
MSDLVMIIFVVMWIRRIGCWNKSIPPTATAQLWLYDFTSGFMSQADSLVMLYNIAVRSSPEGDRGKHSPADLKTTSNKMES